MLVQPSLPTEINGTCNRGLTASSLAAQHSYIVHETALRLRPLQRVVRPIRGGRSEFLGLILLWGLEIVGDFRADALGGRACRRVRAGIRVALTSLPGFDDFFKSATTEVEANNDNHYCGEALNKLTYVRGRIVEGKRVAEEHHGHDVHVNADEG